MKEKSSILRQIPNLLTLINIILGCFAINMAFERNFALSSYSILIAGVIDFLDGFVARRINGTTDFGKSLDSLADIVSFGVAPGFMIYQLLTMSVIMNNPSFSHETINLTEAIIVYSGFLIPVFSAIRLARFNVSKEEGNSFRGLPTPAAGLLIAFITLLFVETENEMIRNLLINNIFLLLLIITICILMVSKFKTLSLKFKNFSFTKENQLRYLFITASLVLIVVFKYLGLPLVIILYLTLSILNNLITKIK